MSSKLKIPYLIYILPSFSFKIPVSISNSFSTSIGLADKEGNLAIGGVAEIVLTVLGAIFLVAGILWLIFDKKEYAKSVKGGVLGFFVFASVGIVILASVWISSLFIV